MREIFAFPFIETTRFFFVLSLLISSSCSTTHQKAMTDSEKCNAQTGNTWVDGRCVTQNSAVATKQACENRGDGSKFVSEKCISPADLAGLSQQCVNDKGVGFYWGEDPTTGEAACLSPKVTRTPEEQCAQDKTAVFKDGICYTAEAFKCIRGGDFWTVAKTCITPAQKTCEAKQDGSTWTNGRCVSKDEAACIASNGPAFAWDSTSNQCAMKRFVDYCNDTSISSDLLQTVSAIKSVFGSASSSCDSIESQLKGVSTLLIDGAALAAKVKNLAPLASYDSLLTLNLPNNQIADLSPLAKLVNLRSLDLSSNQIVDLRPLAQLTAISNLKLDNNSIADYNPLTGFSKLSALSLQNVNLTNAGLQTLVKAEVIINGTFLNLQSMNLSNNCQLSDLSPLSVLNGITSLNVSNTSVTLDKVPNAFLAKDAGGGYTILTFNAAEDNTCIKK